MKKNPTFQSGFGVLNARILVAFSLCSVAASLIIFTFAATPPSVPYPRPGLTMKMSAANAGATSSEVPAAVSADGRYVAFQGNFGGGCCVVAVYDQNTGVTSAEAVSTDGILSFSADGRYLAFSTTGYDNNRVEDVYVRDRQTGNLTWVSVAPDGSPPTCDWSACVKSSWYPSISADGRYVAFYSFASNLVPGDTNQTADIFVRDMVTGITQRVSVASDGTQANGLSVEPSISADGRYVAFRSFATNLVSGNTNTGASCGSQSVSSDIFVHDRQTGTTELVSVGIGGSQDGCSWVPSISGDGRYVAFLSAASTLVPNDPNGVLDTFVRDRQTGTTERVSVTSDGADGGCGPPACGSSAPSISPDGRYVVFGSWTTNLVPEDTNGTGDVFVHDRETGATERVSVAYDGGNGNSTSEPNGAVPPAISADGRYVAFDSFASNLVPNDTNRWKDVFIRDRGPAVGVGTLQTSCGNGSASASGWATFSGGVIASVDDPSNDGAQGAANVGAELIGASLAYRPEHADLFVRLRVISLPAKVGGAPGVLYGLKMTFGASGIRYEVRAAQGESMGSPLFALYNCTPPSPTCTQVAVLSGSMGTTGDYITVSVPLAALGATEGVPLTGLDAYTAFGDATAGPGVTLDDDPLPPTSIPVHSVSLGIAPVGTPETNVVFNTSATLANGNFSGTLPSLSAGSYDVWARACLGSACGKAASAPLTVTQACAAPPVQLVSVVSELTHGSAGPFNINLPLTGTRGVECRTSASLGAGNYMLVYTFANPLTSVAGASVTSGAGMVSSSSIGTDPHQYIVNLTGVSNAQYVTVALANVNDSAGNSSASVATTMGVLIGDVNASGVVTSGDTNLCKAQALRTVTIDNFRNDINASGAITTGDVNIIKQNALSQLPSPP